MKKSVTVEKLYCDVCGAESNEWNSCMICGKVFCYDCRKTQMKEYKHGVYYSGSGDGLYCNDCDRDLILSGDDEKHNAFRKIDDLRNELKEWDADFTIRIKEAEAHLKDIQALDEAMEERNK